MAGTSPIGMNQADTFSEMGVAGGMTLHAMDRGKIYYEALKMDVLTGNMNLIDVVETDTTGKAKIKGDKFITKVTPNADFGKAAQDVTLEYIKAIQGDGVEGNANAYIGEEVVVEALYTRAYANDFAIPLASFGFGIDKLEQDWWKLNDSDRKLLSQWIGEMLGYYSRQALCEGYSNNLTKSPISRTLILNPNSYVPTVGAIPFTTDMATYQADVATALGGLTAPVHLDVPTLVEAADVASQDKYMRPVDIDGKKLYGLLTSREEVRFLRSADQANTYAEYYLQGSALARVMDVVPEAAMVIGDVIIIPDDRAPTITTDGSSNTFGYVKAGRVSTRAKATDPGSHFNVNILLGANALLQYDRTLPDFKEQKDDYGRDLGTLVHACSGFSLPMFDKDTAGIPVQEGSMLIFSSRESTIGG